MQSYGQGSPADKNYIKSFPYGFISKEQFITLLVHWLSFGIILSLSCSIHLFYELICFAHRIEII